MTRYGLVRPVAAVIGDAERDANQPKEFATTPGPGHYDVKPPEPQLVPKVRYSSSAFGRTYALVLHVSLATFPTFSPTSCMLNM